MQVIVILLGASLVAWLLYEATKPDPRIKICPKCGERYSDEFIREGSIARRYICDCPPPFPSP